MFSDDFLIRIELSAANLYSRLALRALAEGKTELARRLIRTAAQERSQAQRIRPIKTGGADKDRWSHYGVRGSAKVWVRGSSLGSESLRVREFLGPSPEHQPWPDVLVKLGSAELLIAFYYLLFRRDWATFREELGHSISNGVSIKQLARGLRCCLLMND